MSSNDKHLPPPHTNPKKGRKRSDVFNDYDGFLDKFKPKLTTDDCYTPANVYDAVLRFVSSKVDLSGRQVVRPFWPGGDYQRFDYPENCIVIDNPPFSFYSKIVRWYIEKGIDFFLFAPYLTAFTPKADISYIITDQTITYENRAKINTAFATNIFPGLRIWLCPELSEMLAACEPPKIIKPKNTYPDYVVTASILGKIVARGVELKIPSKECQWINNLDCLRRNGKGLYGGGFLLSERAAAERAAAERAAGIQVELSPDELEIVRKLSEND